MAHVAVAGPGGCELVHPESNLTYARLPDELQAHVVGRVGGEEIMRAESQVYLMNVSYHIFPLLERPGSCRRKPGRACKRSPTMVKGGRQVTQVDVLHDLLWASCIKLMTCIRLRSGGHPALLQALSCADRPEYKGGA